MKITHHTNSFLSVETSSDIFISDPWSGEANYGGWRSLPELPESELTHCLESASLIYISHLHSDHFCPRVLKLIKDKSKKVLIKEFASKRLLRKIHELGFNNIVELAEWHPQMFGALEITIIPQGISNSAGIDDKLSFDLDTSVLIYDTESNIVFFHLVDNSLTQDQLSDVSNFALSRYKKTPDVATMTCGAASEWPQCFPQLDRAKVRDAYLASQLNLFSSSVKALDAKWVIPGGGRYCVGGRFSGLNKYCAIPQNDDLRVFMPEGSMLLDIEGGGSIKFLCDGNRNSYTAQIRSVPAPSLPDDYLLSLQSHAYQYERYESRVDSGFLEYFRLAKAAWQAKIRDTGIRPIHSIYFKLYDKLPIDQYGNVDIDDGLSLDDEVNILCLHSNNNSDARHVIHIEKSALSAVMIHGFILKQVLSGSLAIQFREPDVFDVATNFSFAFFRATA